MVNFLSLALAVVCLSCLDIAFASEESDPCDKYPKNSQYSWNPHSKSERLARFYALNDEIEVAYTAKDHAAVRALVEEYLGLAKIYRCNWNYGNAIHESNRILGMMSLEDGNIDEAAMYLLRAGKSSGSPQLNTFGPRLDLADALLKLGKDSEVRTYLSDIGSFWTWDEGRIEYWLSSLENGERPELSHYSDYVPPWEAAALWFVALWPVLIVVGLLIFLRRRLGRKWLFGIVSVLAGYVVMYAVSFGLSLVLSDMVSNMSATALDSTLNAFLGLGFLLPLIAVFAISRAFVIKN